MSMRKLNFSGRKKIAWSDISIEITKADIYTITKVEIDNAKYGFPASSKVQLVVKQGQREPSFKLGTVSSPKGLPLPLSKDFLVEDRLRFTLKVADEDGHWLGWSANWHYPAKEAKSSTSEHSFFVFKPDETVRNYQVNCPDEQSSFDGSNPVEVLMNQDLHGRFLKEPEINVLVQRAVLESVFWQAKRPETQETFDQSTWEGAFLAWFCGDEGVDLLDSDIDIQQRLDSKVHEMYRGDVTW